MRKMWACFIAGAVLWLWVPFASLAEKAATQVVQPAGNLSGPSKASQPVPANLAIGVVTDTSLNWTAGSGATSHRLYFGTTSPGLYRGTRTGTTFVPASPLEAGCTYYWRIDEVGTEGTTEGDVWQFTTRSDLVPADIDHDGDVDLDDFARFQGCLTGSGIVISDPNCVVADLDGDLDADQTDLIRFVACMSGSALEPPPTCGGTSPPISPIPPRPAEAMTGSAFVNEVLNFTLASREARIREEIIHGNIPDFLRTFVPIQVSASIDGTLHTIVYEVMPDYLCIGSNDDFVHFPMMPTTAQIIADKFECMLTTRKMTNDIYSQAQVKVAPSPINPNTTDITKVSTFYQHHLTIESQRAGRPLNLLIGGIKKDVVVTVQLPTRVGNVAIYGWHQLNGQPIQPLYLGHKSYYVDYSHGIRLVKGYVLVDGVRMAIADVLRHPKLNVLLSDEGVVEDPRYPY